MEDGAMTQQTKERIEIVGARITYAALGAVLAMGIAWGGLIVRVQRIETDLGACMIRGNIHDVRLAVVESRMP
jgi:hypothetical protein